MKKEISNNIKICELKIDCLNDESCNLFRELIINNGHPFIWTVSERSNLFSNNDDLYKFLKNDFGSNHIIYAIFNRESITGIVGVTNLSNDSFCGELIIGLKQEYRLRHDFLDWWIMFLQMIRDRGVSRMFARIRIENMYVIKLSRKFGFIRSLDDFHKANSDMETFNVKRETSLNEMELSYLEHKRGLR